jgi:hypothetical protein
VSIPKDLSVPLEGLVVVWIAEFNLFTVLLHFCLGLVRNLLLPAARTCRVVLGSPRVALLMRGPLPREIRVGSEHHNLLAVNETSWLERVDLQAQILTLLRRHVDDICVGAVAGRDVESPLGQIRDITNAISEAAVSFRNGASPQQRVELMRKRRQFLSEIRQLVNRTDEIFRLRNATSHQLAHFLVQADKLKYGLRALRRALPVDLESIQVQSAALAKTAASVKDSPFDLVSQFNHLTTLQIWREFSCGDFRNVVEFLQAFSFVGLGARVRFCEASVIDSYAVKVEYISNVALDTGHALCLLDAGLFHTDESGQKVCLYFFFFLKKITVCQICDVIPVGDPRNFGVYLSFSKTALFRHLHSVIFTRNVDLYNPRMPTALLAISLVRSATQLLSANAPDASFENFLRLRYTLRARLVRGEMDGGVSYWSTLIGNLSLPNVAEHLTEASEDDVTSIAKVSAVMMCLADRLDALMENKKQLSTLFLALLGEAASRGARIEVKQSNNDSHPLILKALGIQASSCVVPLAINMQEPKSIVFSDEFDESVGKKRSSRFFRRVISFFLLDFFFFFFKKNLLCSGDCVVQLSSNFNLDCSCFDESPERSHVQGWRAGEACFMDQAN